jgi:hypothetical protein
MSKMRALARRVVETNNPIIIVVATDRTAAVPDAVRPSAGDPLLSCQSSEPPDLVRPGTPVSATRVQSKLPQMPHRYHARTPLGAFCALALAMTSS